MCNDTFHLLNLYHESWPFFSSCPLFYVSSLLLVLVACRLSSFHVSPINLANQTILARMLSFLYVYRWTNRIIPIKSVLAGLVMYFDERSWLKIYQFQIRIKGEPYKNTTTELYFLSLMYLFNEPIYCW